MRFYPIQSSVPGMTDFKPGGLVIHFQEVFVRTTSEISLVEMFSTNYLGAFSDGARRRAAKTSWLS